MTPCILRQSKGRQSVYGIWNPSDTKWSIGYWSLGPHGFALDAHSTRWASSARALPERTTARSKEESKRQSGFMDSDSEEDKPPVQAARGEKKRQSRKLPGEERRLLEFYYLETTSWVLSTEF